MSERANRYLFRYIQSLPLLIVLLVPLLYLRQAFDPEVTKTLLANSLMLWTVVLFIAAPESIRRELSPGRPLRLAVFLLFFIGGLSLFRAINLFQGLNAYLDLLRNGSLCLLCAALAKDRQWQNMAFSCLAFTSAIVALVGILQYYGLMPATRFTAGRWSSTIGNINFAAQFLLVSVLPAAIWLALSSKGRRKIWALLYFSIVAWYFVLCRSRGAWLGGLVGAALAIIMIVRRRRVLTLTLTPRIIFLTLTALCIVLMAVSFLPRPDRGTYEPIFKYFLTSFDPSGAVTNRIRLGIWAGGMELIRDNILTGVGPGNVEGVFPLYRNSEELTLSGHSSTVRYLHNEFLQLAAEGGILYLTAFVFLIVLVLRRGFQCALKSRDRPLVILSIAGTSAIVSTLMHSIFSSNLHRPAAAVGFWMLCGIVYGLGRPSSIGQMKPQRGRLWLLPLCLVSLLSIGELPAQIYAKRARLLLQKDMLQLAKDEIEKVSEISPRFDKALFLKAQIDFKQRKFDSCEEGYIETLKWAPNRDKAHLNLFLCAKAKGDWALANEALKRSELLLGEQQVRRLLSK